MRQWFFYMFLIVVVFVASACPIVFSGQSLPSHDTADGVSTTNTDEVGGGYSTIELPLIENSTHKCVQGAGGSYSHTGTSTHHDLDFDTSNTEDEEVYAPISGTARVHTESTTLNFGYHINIDIGDGTYIVIGHMKEIFISDGEEVAAGELLGHEGCTGLCTGDHIHIGRHEGDASLKAEYGTSVSVYYHVADATAEEEFEAELGDSLICGIESEGDPVDGHEYLSGLPVTAWHPDGTLIKSPSSPNVYALENGQKRLISDEEVFWSLGYSFDNLALVSDEEMDCFADGEEMNKASFIDATFDEFGWLWLVVGISDDSSRYRQVVSDAAWEEVLASWGLNYSEANLPGDSMVDLEDWSEVSGYASFRDGTVLKEESHSDVYVVTDGVAAPVVDWNTYLMLGFYDRNIITVSDGMIEAVQDEVGNCSADLWCITSEVITQCGGGFDLTGHDNSDDTGGDLSTAGGSDTDSESDDDYGDTSEEIPCEDEDRDGYCSEHSGGEDCWDDDSTVHPGAEDICGDGIDQDCSGRDEACPASEWDTDGDGVMDDADNCIYNDNADQSDIDHDGLGDACDTDMDGDGVINPEDCDMDNPAVTVCDTSHADTGTIPEEVDTDTDADADTDADSDSDTDSDTDADSDSDSDSDADADADSDSDSDADVPSDSGESDTGSVSASTSSVRTLDVSWTTPFSATATYITMSGEYLFADGSYGFTWRTLESVTHASTVEYEISGVDTGDTLRFSVEYEDSAGNVSWSCIAPYPSGTLQGRATAEVDGASITVSTADDPTSDGCGLILTVP